MWLLHGGDPAAHIAAIEKRIQLEEAGAESRPRGLSLIPETREWEDEGAIIETLFFVAC